MKSFRLIHLGVLPLLLEALTPAYAQRDQRDGESRRPPREQPQRQEQPRRQEQPQRQQEARPENRPQPERRARQEQPQRQQEARPENRPQPERRVRQEQPQRQQEARPESRPQPERRARQDQPQPARAQQERQPQREAKGNQEQQRQRQTNRPVQPAQREYDHQHRGAWMDRRAHNWQSEHRSWQQRGGYDGYRIPDTRFRGTFGPRHGFRMFSYPLLVVGGFPRFQYGGYWISVMDPWPEYWSDDWYGSDEVYIDYYGGGYYLRNRMHPMDRIAVTVFVN